MNNELQIKLERLRTFMKEKCYDGVLLCNNENFCWLSCGHYAFVDKSSSNAAAKFLVMFDKQYVITNSSEQFRIPEEELSGMDFELIAYPWHGSEADVLLPYLKGKNIASDNGAFGSDNCADAITAIRYVLTDEEITRYREIGSECANIVEDCCREISIGQTEYEIAGNVTGKLMASGFQVPVCLIASDDRLLKYRHPIPTAAKVFKRAMIAICAQKYGLTISMSRIVSFFDLEDEVQKKYDALLHIDATYILSTVPGAKAGEIVKRGRAIYEKSGYGMDFHLHHQGGALGYLTRDYCANEANESIVLNNQAFSWNPTIAGVKLEDTYIVVDGHQEIISQTETWPNIEVTIDGKTIRRPLILMKKTKE